MQWTKLFNLNANLVLFLVKVLCFQNWRGVSVCLARQGINRKDILILIFKYACLISLTYIYSDKFIPSANVDLVHHALLENQVQYKKTVHLLGHWVDHVYDEAGDIKREQRFAETQQRFLDTFGFALLGQTENSSCMGGCYLQRADCAENSMMQLAFRDIDLQA